MTDWIIAVSTAIYMGATLWLIIETRRARLLQEKPQLQIYLKRAKNWGSMLDLIIKNIGYSGAYNIKLDTESEFNLLDTEGYTLKNLGYFKNGISFLPVNGEKENSIIFLDNNFEEKIKWKINISATYRDKNGRKHKDDFLLDLSEFENSFLPQEEPLYKIQKSISKIEKYMEIIGSGFPNLNVITQTKDEYSDEMKKKREEDKKALERLIASMGIKNKEIKND